MGRPRTSTVASTDVSFRMRYQAPRRSRDYIQVRPDHLKEAASVMDRARPNRTQTVPEAGGRFRAGAGTRCGRWSYGTPEAGLEPATRLVVDEVGYLTYGTDAANMLFHVVNDRHRRQRAMIFTTNKPVTSWGRVLHDEDLAQAIVDRVLERGRMLTLDGPSHRTKHLGLEETTPGRPAPQVARISGIRAPEFPEPTPPG